VTPPAHTPPQAAPVVQGADPLRSVGAKMIIFGAMLIVFFAVPTKLDPLTFNFSMFGDIFGADLGVMLAFLMVPVIGLLSVVFGFLPLGTMVKGVIAGTLGIAAFAITFAFMADLEWQFLCGQLGMLVLLTGLVIRGGYRGSLVARILVTLGVLATLAPNLIPNDAGVPLVGVIQGLGDASTGDLIGAIVHLVSLVLVIAALLAWLPAPASGAASLIYWLLIGLMIAGPLAMLLIDAGGDAFQAPGKLLEFAVTVAPYGLASWGLGALLGKSTE
jgi:hypothetical protein